MNSRMHQSLCDSAAIACKTAHQVVLIIRQMGLANEAGQPHLTTELSAQACRRSAGCSRT